MFDESRREDYVEYLLSVKQFEEAIRQLAVCVNDDHFISPNATTRHNLWMKLCELCAYNPLAASNVIKVDYVIRR